MNLYWTAWLFGMAVPFVIKFANFMLLSDPGRYSFAVNTLRFMFADAKVATTTFISMTFELLVGAWYIDSLPVPYMPTIELPQHWVMALFLAAILEVIAPIVIKGLVAWAVDSMNRFRGVNVQPKEKE